MKRETNLLLIKHASAALLTITLAVISIIQLLEYFIGDSFFLKTVGVPIKFLFFFLIIFLLLSIYMFFLLYRKHAALETEVDIFSYKKETGDSLFLIINNAYNSKRWAEVVKIGRQLSESLWYTGKFKIRVKIGELVESSSAFIDELDIQAETLIDDLGWTNYRLQNKKEALRNINRGLKIAEKIPNFYLISKGNRHCADIALANNKLKEYEEFMQLATSALSKITSINKKNEMEGNLNYTIAKYHFKIKEYDKALSFVKLSMTNYQSNNDKDREVKLFNLQGEIYLSLGNEEEVIDSFQDGLTMATTISNIVNIVKNSSSLAEYYYKQERYEYAAKMIDIAVQNSLAMDDPLLIEKIRQLQILINDKLK